MSFGIPAEIIEVNSATARVTMFGVETTVDVRLIDEPRVGDYIIIQAGCAREKIDQESYIDLYAELTYLLTVVS